VGYYLDKRSKTSPAATPSPSTPNNTPVSAGSVDGKKRKALALTTPPSTPGQAEQQHSIKKKEKDKKKEKKVMVAAEDDDSSATRESKRVRFGKPHSKGMQGA
jgi:hypothetical protein